MREKLETEAIFIILMHAYSIKMEFNENFFIFAPKIES